MGIGKRLSAGFGRGDIFESVQELTFNRLPQQKG
jgi:hypothetical protein